MEWKREIPSRMVRGRLCYQSHSLIFLWYLQSQPVEGFYRSRGKLMEFDLPGGIPESWPKLLEALNLDEFEERQSAAA